MPSCPFSSSAAPGAETLEGRYFAISKTSGIKVVPQADRNHFLPTAFKLEDLLQREEQPEEAQPQEPMTTRDDEQTESRAESIPADPARVFSEELPLGLPNAEQDFALPFRYFEHYPKVLNELQRSQGQKRRGRPMRGLLSDSMKMGGSDFEFSEDEEEDDDNIFQVAHRISLKRKRRKVFISQNLGSNKSGSAYRKTPLTLKEFGDNKGHAHEEDSDDFEDSSEDGDGGVSGSEDFEEPDDIVERVYMRRVRSAATDPDVNSSSGVVVEYFVKYKGKAFIHSNWLEEEKLLSDQQSKARLGLFLKSNGFELGAKDYDPEKEDKYVGPLFDESYTIAEVSPLAEEEPTCVCASIISNDLTRVQ